MNKLNGQDIIAQLIGKGYTPTEASKFYKDMVDILSKELATPDTSITISRVGTFTAQLKKKHPNFLKAGESTEVLKVKYVPSRTIARAFEESRPKKRGLL